jgi:hypothetical protein
MDEDGSLGWSELAAGGVEVIAIPGYHSFIMMEPFVRILARNLKDCLERIHTRQLTHATPTGAREAAEPLVRTRAAQVGNNAP